MSNGTLEILRQGAMGWWGPLCIIACLVLITYALSFQIWKSLRGLVSLGLIVVGVVGTTLAMVFRGSMGPGIIVVWTFVVLALLSAVFYLRLRPQLAWRRVSALLTLRVVALAGLVLMFFEPGCRYMTRPVPERPLLFVIDASGSMSFPDVQNGPTRVQSVWQALRPELPKIKDHFVPMYYTFSTELRDLKNIEDLQTLVADGKGTDIGKALHKARYKTNHPDSALVLISDGINNIGEPIETARELGWAVNTVRVGSDQVEPATLANVAIDNVEPPDDFLVGHEAKVKVTVKSTALNGRVVDVKLAAVDAAGKPISEIKSAQRVLESAPDGQTVELPYTPRTVGVHRLAAWVDPIVGERSTVDNRQEFQGLAMDPRIKVLYIEGRLRPEYKPLRSALMRDSNVEAAMLLRTRGSEFSVEGTVDGHPVEGIPKTLEEWKKFDVVILGDLDASFLSASQQQAIEQFVSSGKGLVMLGGQNNFGPGGYKGTPVEAALPVFVGDQNSAQEKEQFVPRLTADGAAHPMMEGMAEWFGVGDKKPSKELPALRGNVVVPKAKSGAQVIAVHPGRTGPDGNPEIILAVQRYGEGRSCAFTADTTNLWFLPLRAMGQDSPYNKFWGQMVRWLAGEDVRNRQRGAGIEALLNKSVYQTGERVVVRAMVRDDRGDATEYAIVSLTLKKAKEKDVQEPLSAVESRRGLYEHVIDASQLREGDYTMELSAATKAGKLLGKQEIKFKVLPPLDEMHKLAANPTLLKNLATATGGKAYELHQLPKLIEDLVKMDRHAREAEEVVVPLGNTIGALGNALGYRIDWNRTYRKYNLPMQGLWVVVLLAGEWILRRKWALP